MRSKKNLVKLCCIAAASLMIWNIPQFSFADDQGPWFTGPILASAGDTVPAGHFVLEPYFFLSNGYGSYTNNWHSYSQPDLIGLTPNMVAFYGINSFTDLEVSLPFKYNRYQGQFGDDIGDFTATLGFQAYKAQANSWLPDLRITIGETFPTGRYQNLNPVKLGIDGTGDGFYNTTVGLNFQKVNTVMNHILRTRVNLDYSIPTKASVHNFNRYGGSTGTDGKIKAGDQFTADLGLEYVLTRNWVPALDVVYNSSQATTFTGNPGFSANRLPNVMGGPGSQLISLAPALEYNFNENLGVIAGVWFSVDGRNTSQFTTGVVALNYVI